MEKKIKIGAALPVLHMHTFVKSMQRNSGQSANAPLNKKTQILLLSLPPFCQIGPEFPSANVSSRISFQNRCCRKGGPELTYQGQIVSSVKLIVESYIF
jgi:hypothetical protein